MEAEQPGTSAEPTGLDVRIAVLLALSAVLAAGIGFLSSQASGDAGGHATAAIRGDVRRGSEIVNDSARIYAEDAPLAFQVAEADLRAQEARSLEGSATGVSGDLLAIEAAAQTGLAKLLARSAVLVGNPAAATGIDAAALMARLADLRARYPDLVQVYPEADAADAADGRRKSSLLLAALIPVSVGFLCGALAEGFPHRRRPLFWLGSVGAAAGAVMAIIVQVSI